MKLFKLSVTAALVWLSALLLSACSEDMGIDNRDKDYGHVQFKLYKAASYEPNATLSESRATKPELDYLAEASKVNVTLKFGETTISQTLTLSSAGNDLAEFGLRSTTLRLLAGSYQVVTFTLYDANDEELYNGSGSDTALEVVAGGLTQFDLTANVTPRGKVQFTITKDLDGFTPPNKDTRAVNRQYAFSEIKTIDIIVRRNSDNLLREFKNLKAKFSIHFNEDDDIEDGYQTSSLTCDSLLSLEAGEWTVRGYRTMDANKLLLEDKSNFNGSTFEVSDNRTTKAKIAVTLREADEYIKDYYALYEIWKAMDGKNWYYKGQEFPRGVNWDFNKDPDLWGYQPGVQLHPNGRVAKITFSDFGFAGKIPAQIGQLTELIELYLGSHNDYNIIPDDPSLAFNQSLTERSRNRMANHKKYLSIIHPAIQLSEPIALAYAEHGITLPETALYANFTEKEIIDPTTGWQRPEVRPKDTSHGVLSNRLTEIHENIGNLRKLEYFFIANSTLEKLPATFKNLEACTDLEIYNCPNMKEFPMVLAQMPALVSVNIANNRQWGEQSDPKQQEIYKGLDALANGPSKEKIQILYCRQNKLKELPASFRNLKKLGMLDMAQNEIETLHPMGKGVQPVQVLFDYNKITSVPTEDGVFCGFDDIESFTMSYNKLTKVPDIFTSKTLLAMKSVSFANNEIDGFENEGNGYKGINVETLTLVGNKPLTKFPAALATSGSNVSAINLRGCSINNIPEESFKGKNTSQMISIDLSYNQLDKLPDSWSAENLPYLYGVDLSYNRFAAFPMRPGPLNSAELTVFAIRGQRDANGKRCLREWPTGIYQHKGLRGFYIGSNDLRQVTETISYLIYNLDISDNPNIVFDAKDICDYWRAGIYNLIYDKTQDIRNCDEMKK